MHTQDIAKLYSEYVMSTYAQSPVVLVKGRGMDVWDIEGKRYLDFFPGWAVSGLGHCHPKVVRALREQAKKILHVPNNYYNELQAKLAQEICRHSFAGKVFFCNSGAEAIESAIKLARLYGNPQRNKIICMENSFHGRTLAAITATGQEKYKKGFEPLPTGFDWAVFDKIESVEAKVTPDTVAVLIELIQGEGGINQASQKYVKELVRLCNEKDLLLIVDEVQTGMGRTGRMFCYQHYGIEPDIMCLAKSLGGGIPIGAVVAKKEIADVFSPGKHASTFGGSPLACSAALAVFDAIDNERLLENARDMGEYLVQQLIRLQQKHSIVIEVKGLGLMLGVDVSRPGKDIVEACLKKGLLINCTQERILRLMPAITVTKKQIDKAIKILDRVL